MSEEKFKCRICGCKEYDEITKRNDALGPGFRSWVEYFVCRGCSIIFNDVKKFTKKSKK